MMFFYARFAVKHVKKAKNFSRGSAHAPHPRRVTILRCAFHPSRRGEIFELELSAKARVNRMHSEKSAIYYYSVIDGDRAS